MKPSTAPTSISIALLSSLLFVAPAFAQDQQQGPPAEVALDSEAYQKRSGEEKQAILWSAIEKEPYDPNKKLPSGGAIRGALKMVWGKLTLRSTFEDDTDVRRKRRKTFHRWGTSVAVRYEVARAGAAGRLAGRRASNPYTGVFATGAVGIARLSLGLGDVDSLWVPGMGLKLFVDGKPSVNIHSIPTGASAESKDFMAATLSTKIDGTPLDPFLKLSGKADPTHRRTDHVAAVTGRGEVVAEPKSPFRIEFRPGKVEFESEPSWGAEDFRESLAKIRAGSVLYEVWAVETEEGTSEDAVHIGNIRTTSGFVASEFQDRRLHFKHER